MSEVSVINNQRQGEEQLELPPGFRFHPTDEEVVSHYLIPKALNRLFTCLVIADVDLNKCEPWELPSKQPLSLLSSVRNFGAGTIGLMHACPSIRRQG
jgi:hypothetical protein